MPTERLRAGILDRLATDFFTTVLSRMTLHGCPDLAEATFAFAKLDLLLQFPVYPPPTVASALSFIPISKLWLIAYNNPTSHF